MDNYCDEERSVEERCNDAINAVEGWIGDINRILDGDIKAIPSWMNRKQYVASICDSVIANMKYIKKQYKN